MDIEPRQDTDYLCFSNRAERLALGVSWPQQRLIAAAAFPGMWANRYVEAVLRAVEARRFLGSAEGLEGVVDPWGVYEPDADHVGSILEEANITIKVLDSMRAEYVAYRRQEVAEALGAPDIQTAPVAEESEL